MREYRTIDNDGEVIYQGFSEFSYRYPSPYVAVVTTVEGDEIWAMNDPAKGVISLRKFYSEWREYVVDRITIYSNPITEFF